MDQGESKRITRNDAPTRRWVLALVSMLLALSVILHLGQAVPVHADLGTLPVVVAGHGDSPCEPGQHLKAAHCSTTAACSLYAPLEVSPEILISDRAHTLPSADAVHVRWQATPQLQPPQYSLSV